MPTFEVLTRRPSGQETVWRYVVDTVEQARQSVLDAGVPADCIVAAGPAPITPETLDRPSQPVAERRAVEVETTDASPRRGKAPS